MNSETEKKNCQQTQKLSSKTWKKEEALMQFLRQNTFNENLHILFPKKSECLNSFESSIIYYNTFLKKDCRALRYAPICWKCFFRDS